MKKHLSNDSNAVAPAIGDILMIALIVVLGAVIVSYVLSTSDLMTKTYIVGTTAKQTSPDTIEITFLGGNDADKLIYLNVSINNQYYNNTQWQPAESNTFNGDGITPIRTGSTVSIQDSNITNNLNHVILIAHFNDGHKQVVLDTEI